MSFSFSADLRCAGQSFTLNVPIALPVKDRNEVKTQFERRDQETYGVIDEAEPHGRRHRAERGERTQLKDLPKKLPQQVVCSKKAAYIRRVYFLGKLSMIVEFRRWGNSLAVRIPKDFANAIHAKDGKRCELSIRDGALVLRPLAKPRRARRYSLDELLAHMTRDNVPQEVGWGPPRGNEAW